MAATSEEQRALASRIGAHSRWALEPDRTAATAPARAASPSNLAYYYAFVDPNGELDPRERDRRAENARTAYYLRLSNKSLQARQKKSGKGKAAGPTGGTPLTPHQEVPAPDVPTD